MAETPETVQYVLAGILFFVDMGLLVAASVDRFAAPPSVSVSIACVSSSESPEIFCQLEVERFESPSPELSCWQSHKASRLVYIHILRTVPDKMGTSHFTSHPRSNHLPHSFYFYN